MGNACSSTLDCQNSSKSAKKSITDIVKQILKDDNQNLGRQSSLMNYATQRQWMLRQSSFINKDKFFTSYKEYLRDQTFVSEVWIRAKVGEEDVATIHYRTQSQAFIPRLKVLIRTGVPLDKMRTVILEIFKKAQAYNDLEYECALKVAFPGKVPPAFKNVPLFSFSQNMDEVLPVHFLNKDGLEAFKRIMWIYEKNVPLLEYSPLLSQVVASLLLFLKDHEVYCVVKEMIDQSRRLIYPQQKKDAKMNLKWHFTLTKQQFESSLESLSQFLKDKTNGFNKIWKHFKEIKFDSNDLFWKLIKTLFFEYLPLSTALKVFMAYMNEGIKVYYRFMLALLQLLENDILQSNSSDEVMSLVREKAMNMAKNTVQLLSNTAYGLNLRPLKQKFSITNNHDFSVPESSRIYFPELTDQSSTANTLHFETIWEWLPDEFKLAKPILAYTSKTNGWSLNTLYAHCSEKSRYKGVLILIKATNSAIFGAFIDGVVQMQHDTIGTDQSFVFKLDPEEKKYAAIGRNKIHLMCSKDFISVGAGCEGSAIYLNSDLLSGSSYKSETYNNAPLHHIELNQGHYRFECATFELYWID